MASMKIVQPWWSMIFLMLSMVAIRAFECPKGNGCSNCLESRNRGVYEMVCETGSQQNVSVLIYPRHLLLKCLSIVDWARFELGSLQHNMNYNYLIFNGCNAPNNYGSVAKQVFIGDLKILQITKSQSDLTRDDLRNLSSLQRLIVTEQSSWTPPEDLIDDLPNLISLVMTYSDLRYVPTFCNSSNFEFIQLRNNKIQNLVPNSFGKNVRFLELNDNEIMEILPNTFDELEKLQILNLEDNRLTTLSFDLFADLESLQELYLSKNNLTILPEGIFDSLKNLRVISMNHCNLDYMANNTFWETSNLHSMELVGNNLRTLPINLLYNLYELKTLDLSFNQISFLPDFVFKNLEQLEKLDLSRNYLTEITENLFNGLTSLRELNLNDNNLLTIHINAFGHMKNLRIGNFLNNPLSLDYTKETSPFRSLEYVEILHLDDNVTDSQEIRNGSTNKIVRDYL